MNKIVQLSVFVISLMSVRVGAEELSSEVFNPALAVSGDAVVTEAVSTPVAVAVVGVSVDSMTAAMLSEMNQSLENARIIAETKQLPDLINKEKSEKESQFKTVGKSELELWQKALRKRAIKLDLQVIKLADKGVVTTWGVQNVVDDYKRYKRLKDEANERLSFFGLNIPENGWEYEYNKFESVPLYLNADDKNQNIRRFFIKKTGKDVVVQKGMAFNIWIGAVSSVVTWFIIGLL